MMISHSTHLEKRNKLEKKFLTRGHELDIMSSLRMGLVINQSIHIEKEASYYWRLVYSVKYS